ncbi:fibronectin type III domain-containing protein, partial [Intestinibacter sp.]|uniref:fibronectin type III domain-containing protein n=1 Tax=Intestinibacter sp. TaxID=1965304 RepID=UPI003F14DA89
AKIPQYILDEIKKDNGDLTERDKEGWLGEFDYTYMSGWMYCVNNKFPNYGASSYKPKDGDIIRWQFTVWGYGADICDNSEWGQPAYLNYANRDKLTQKIAEINSASNKNKLLSNSTVKNAYNNAINILEDMTSSQSKVDKAYNELTSAVNEASQNPTPTVKAVEGFKVTGATASKINLAWNKVDDCTGYKIYRYYSSSDSFKLIKTIDSKNTLTYENTDRISATTYRYKIRAYKVVDGKTIYSDYSNEIKATTNPLKPKFVSSTAKTNSVTLNWNKTSRADGYEVYRYSTTSKKYSLIGETNANTTTYNDSGRSSATSYTYKIRAYKLVDGVKHYSNYSDSLKVVTKPLTPVVTLKSTVAGKVTVTWSNTSSRATGYKVYMATSKTGTYSLIKTTTSKSYTKTGLTKGKTYYFKVRAYRTVDGKNIYSDYSTIKSIVVKK